MGAGKSTVGRRLADRLKGRFFDSDDEIERAAGMTIPEIFARYGEPHFRDGERKVIARLLREGPSVLATGGGAFMDPHSRALMLSGGHVVWLRADLDTLVARCARRADRPLLQAGDPREILATLQAAREPVYAEAHDVVDSMDGPHDAVVAGVLAALRRAGAVDAPLGDAGGRELS